MFELGFTSFPVHLKMHPLLNQQLNILFVAMTSLRLLFPGAQMISCTLYSPCYRWLPQSWSLELWKLFLCRLVVSLQHRDIAMGALQAG